MSGIVRQADITSLILAQTSRSFLPPPLTDKIVQQLNPLLQQMTPESQPGARGTLLSILAPSPSLNPFTLQMYANLFWAQTFSFPITSRSTSVDVASSIFSLILSFQRQPHWDHTSWASTESGQMTITWLPFSMNSLNYWFHAFMPPTKTCMEWSTI